MIHTSSPSETTSFQRSTIVRFMASAFANGRAQYLMMFSCPKW